MKALNRQFGIAGLKALNEWRDEILIEASTLLLILGFIMGTVDIFVGGGVATALWFKVVWAIVQALAIDGLFFAVWGKVAKAQWTRADLGRNIPLVAVGLVLAIVAALVNDILTFQQINGIADSIDAIKRLGFDVQTFTHVRAVLVVGVGVLVQLFCRADGTAEMGHLNGTSTSGTVGQASTGTMGHLPVVGQANGTPAQVGQASNGTGGTPVNIGTPENGTVASGTPGTPEQVGHLNGTAVSGAGQMGHLNGTGGTVGQRNTDKLPKMKEGPLPDVQTQQEVGHLKSAHVDKSGTPENGTVDKVRDILKDRPTISVRALAKELSVPKTTAANWRLKALEPGKDILA